MKNLQELLVKIRDISDALDEVGISPAAGGVTTKSNHIKEIKKAIDSNNFFETRFRPIFEPEYKDNYEATYLNRLETELKKLQPKIPNIRERIDFNVAEALNELIEKDDFTEQWNKLSSEEKNSFLYFDKEIYKIVRKKVDVSEFKFLFDDFPDEISISYPQNIKDWIEAPIDSKVLFYKLRKNAQNTEYEEFFNSTSAKDAEGKSKFMRKMVADSYLRSNKNNTDEPCWYDRLDMLHDKHWAFSSIYHFFSELEDEFTGYDKIQKSIRLPVILRKWKGSVPDEDAYNHEMKLLDEECKGKSWEEEDKIWEKYPLFKLARSLQRGLTNDEFSNLKEEAKETEFEEFFNHPMTQKMSDDMPYKREDYMFVYFREQFKKELKRKNKP
jgi:hypothetical protein